MGEIIKLAEIKKLIDASTQNSGKFEKEFVEKYYGRYGERPSIVGSLVRGDMIGLCLSGALGRGHVVVGSSQGKPLAIRSYPAEKQINNLSFNITEYHMVSTPQGRVVSSFCLPSGNLVHLNEQGRLEDEVRMSYLEKIRIQNICEEYNCVIYGAMTQEGYVALDIADMGNQAYYKKPIADIIFGEAGLYFLKDVPHSEADSALREHGSVTVKIYDSGELILFSKADAQPVEPILTAESAVIERLKQNYRKASSMPASEVCEQLFQDVPQWKRRAIVEEIEGWKRSLKRLPVEEIFRLEKLSL